MRITAGRRLKVLDFDIENRPLSYWIPDRPTAEITAIAVAWTHHPRLVTTWVLGRDDPAEFLAAFKTLYDEADMVTGHYITRHDLPILQAGMMEYGLPLLGEKLVEDTKTLMVKKSDIPATQEHLCEMLGVPAPKVHMTQQDWREANRLTPEGIAKTIARVSGDVKQHMLLRVAMREAGLLREPRMWTP